MSCRLPSPFASTPWHGLETIAWYWLWSGALCLLVVPAARSYSPLFGWVDYWLVGAPLVLLTGLHQRRFTARLRSLILARARARHGNGGVTARSHLARRQGRHLAKPRVGPRRLGLAALFNP